jgi:hypothetical protein
MPVAPGRSLAERLFWPAAGLAALALGGFVYLFYLMFASHTPREQDHGAPAVAQAQQKVASPEVKLDEVQQGQSPLMIAEMASPETPADTATIAAAKPDTGEAPAAVEAPKMEAPAAAAPKPPAEKPDVNPYAVPSNKPYLTHDMFENKPPANAAKPKAPAPPAPATPAAAAAAKPKAPAAPASPPPSTATARPADRLASPVTPNFRGKIYVLKDGRRISTVSTVDLGDSYGVKDLNSSFITFLKSDVSEIISR